MIAAAPHAFTARAAASAAALVVLAACSGDRPTGPAIDPPPVVAGCAAASLGVGESIMLAQGQNCIDLRTPGSSYMLGVINTGRASGSVAPFELVGRLAGAVSGSVAPAPATNAVTIAAEPWVTARAAAPATVADEAKLRRLRTHERVLDVTRNLQRAIRNRTQASATPLSGGPSFNDVAAAPASALNTVGDTATLRIPDINATNACNSYFDVKTRVVYATAHAILVEDVKAPLAGRMDSVFRSIGDEFEQTMWPVLTTYFGDPLRMDARLDANGKLIMLFSPTVNDKFNDIAGFVIGCDFFTRAQGVPSSNEGEVFYAMVPTSETVGTGNETIRGWRRTMRSTIIHEAKHITSYAARIATNAEPEESWLEEGTARHSEEIYARSVNGATWKGNATYAALACEVRPLEAGCTDRPYVMFKHYDGLYDYLGANGGKSPLGKVGTDDYTFYSSAWSLVRWAADLAASEPAFFLALTGGPRTGISNLESAAARPWAEMVGDWTMALALDDYTGLATARPQRVASWNMRDVFRGMNADFREYYPRAQPWPSQTVQFGAFTVQGTSLRGGSGSVVQLAGTWPGSQIVELQLPGGGVPSTTLRLVATRVQ
ncbi:MAG TPA: hypothetical protein VFT96_13110 [Gemmatimonadaceae bacterium]|nr:hypothetical protein [Gemmatimonadaceae bacterium]